MGWMEEHQVTGKGLCLRLALVLLGLGVITWSLGMQKVFHLSVPILILLLVYAGLAWAVPAEHRSTYKTRERWLFVCYLLLLFLAVVDDLSPGPLFLRQVVALGLNTVIIVSLLVLTGYVLKDLFGSSRVGHKAIISGFFGYIMLGLVWAHIYTSMEIVGLKVLDTPEHSGKYLLQNYIDELYFSLVTLTTLGYGDLVPVSSAAKVAAALEAVSGQFYIAVLVGALVGMYLRDRRDLPGNGPREDPPQNGQTEQT